MIDRRRDAAKPVQDGADEDMSSVPLDPSELSRLVAEFSRQQTAQPIVAPKPAGIIKRSLPYAALVVSAMLAAFSVYRTSNPPQPAIVAQPPAPSPARQATVLPDKLRQISNCQLESLRVYPQQGDVRALQVYNLCMTGAGFTPDYSCDTTVGVPAYNPECWTPGKNM